HRNVPLWCSTHSIYCTSCSCSPCQICICSFETSTASPGIYPLSLHDALPIFSRNHHGRESSLTPPHPPTTTSATGSAYRPTRSGDRKSTRLNSSHVSTSYAVFCL